MHSMLVKIDGHFDISLASLRLNNCNDVDPGVLTSRPSSL